MRYSLLFTLSCRNLWRNAQRNLISSAAIIAAVMSLVLGDGLVEGIDESVIRSQETVLGGEVLLRPKDYPSDGRHYPLALTLPIDSSLSNWLNQEAIAGWTARLYFRARCIKGSDSLPIKVIGYDPQNENTVFDQEKWNQQGDWPQSAQEIAIGHGFAKLMNLDIGDRIILEARTRPGSLNASEFTVSGIINAHNSAVDAFTAWMPLSAADDFVLTDGARSHIGIRSQKGRAASLPLASEFSLPSWTASTAKEEVADLMKINEFRRQALDFITVIIMAIAATGITNTVMMATYERRQEIGILKAMGMDGLEIMFLFLSEGALLGLCAGSVGVLLSASINYHLSVHGIDISQQAEVIGEMAIPTSMFTLFSWMELFWALLFAVMVSVLGSAWPAKQAIAISAADAVRGD